MMSYIPHILTFLLVLSPLFIPVGVTIVHAFEPGGLARPFRCPPPPCERRRLQLADEFRLTALRV